MATDKPEPKAPALPPTPWTWRLAIGLGVLALAGAAYVLRDVVGPRGVAAFGVVCFIGVVALFSANLRAVNWRTVGWGIALQVLLALFILKFEVFGYRPGYELFSAIAGVVTKFLEFTNEGSRFVFGKLADPPAMNQVFGEGNGFVFAFSALPTIIFVSSFFTVLYYFGVLQFVVRLFARGMMYLMRTSGAETLSAAANVFMGQTEAPLIVKPYVERMTQSELLALMVGGMATISGGVMAVYIALGADKVAILATSVMAAPCGLYLAKLLLPETEQPETRGIVKTAVDQGHANVIDAAAAGASDGLKLALNVAAMLIAFLAFIALFDYLLAAVPMDRLSAGLTYLFGYEVTLPQLSLQLIFSRVFAPVAFLMGVEGKDVGGVADLLGIKLVANEFVAYVKLTSVDGGYRQVLTPRSYTLATYALTGFANISSIGIQLGGIGAMAPSRRGDLARLGGRALLAGFLATLVNAAMAGVLLDPNEPTGGPAMTTPEPQTSRPQPDPLLEAARQARQHAHAPFSGFKVGAALEAADGRVITGCNIENATYGLTVCAERVAVFKAVSEGHRHFTRVAVVADTAEPTPPCGACRQILWEFGGDLEVILGNLAAETARHRLRDLLPHPFDARLLSG
jgi:concentrative nucleoside transporter, CNT family